MSQSLDTKWGELKVKYDDKIEKITKIWAKVADGNINIETQQILDIVKDSKSGFRIPEIEIH